MELSGANRYKPNICIDRSSRRYRYIYTAGRESWIFARIGHGSRKLMHMARYTVIEVYGTIYIYRSIWRAIQVFVANDAKTSES